MDYVVNLLDVPVWYYTIAIGIAVLLRIGVRRWDIALLAGYAFFILTITVLARPSFEGQHFEPRLFWSYHVPELREQIIMNIAGFLPVGVLGVRILKWRIIPAAAAFSAGIELLQMITKRGLFEYDDIFHNCLGAVTGCGICMLIVFARGRSEAQKACSLNRKRSEAQKVCSLNRKFIEK